LFGEEKNENEDEEEEEEEDGPEDLSQSASRW
jgi:hypothetical protein